MLLVAAVVDTAAVRAAQQADQEPQQVVMVYIGHTQAALVAEQVVVPMVAPGVVITRVLKPVTAAQVGAMAH
jgi:hypothetical protein